MADIDSTNTLTQGRDCTNPVPPVSMLAGTPEKPSRAVDIIFWVAGVALLCAFLFAVFAPAQTDEIVATLLGLG